MMEEAVLARYGLLGLFVLVLLTYGPRWLDKMTTWAVKHGEAEDRADERFMGILADELKEGRIERTQTIKSLTEKIELLEKRLSEALVLLRDFDDRMRLHMQRLNKGEQS